MSKSLSIDLRERVIAAIEGGLSCRAAAERFGVSASSAIRWRQRQRKSGDFAPRQQGGDRKSQYIEAHAQMILAAVAEKSDITLLELRGKLMEQGVAAGVASLWRFFKRRKITLKKRLRTPPNNGAAM
jgi:transposase